MGHLSWVKAICRVDVRILDFWTDEMWLFLPEEIHRQKFLAFQLFQTTISDEKIILPEYVKYVIGGSRLMR